MAIYKNDLTLHHLNTDTLPLVYSNKQGNSRQELLNLESFNKKSNTVMNKHKDWVGRGQRSTNTISSCILNFLFVRNVSSTWCHWLVCDL